MALWTLPTEASRQNILRLLRSIVTLVINVQQQKISIPLLLGAKDEARGKKRTLRAASERKTQEDERGEVEKKGDGKRDVGVLCCFGKTERSRPAVCAPCCRPCPSQRCLALTSLQMGGKREETLQV
eukprot:superscaffoldBa00000733_g6869